MRTYTLTNSDVAIRDDGASCPIEGSEYRAWLAEGNTPEPDVPPLPSIQDFTDALTRHLDTVAQQRRYDNRITCALRAGYPGPFHAEGAAFATWMDACNNTAYQMLAQVQAGTIPMPESAADAIAVLPSIVWPT